MPQSLNLNRQLVLTEVSLQSAAMVENLCSSISEKAERLADQYPSAGWTGADIAAEFYRHLRKRVDALCETASQ